MERNFSLSLSAMRPPSKPKIIEKGPFMRRDGKALRRNISWRFSSSLLSSIVDQKEADWRKAMGEEKMTWAQGWLDKEQMDKPANAYALISIPRLILIDREGRIVCSTNLPDEITEYLQKHITQ